MRHYLLAGLLFLFQTAVAQQKNKFQWTSTVKAGVMFGASTDNFHMQAMTGLKYTTWQLTAGGGVDCYYWRTVPIFISLSKDLLKKRNTPFVSSQFGINFPWIKNLEEDDWSDYRYHKGFYGNLDAGYRIAINSNASMTLSIGYSQKKLSAEKIYYSLLEPRPPFNKVETFRENYSYSFNRLSFSVGLSF
jgi:hypothetical protein